MSSCEHARCQGQQEVIASFMRNEADFTSVDISQALGGPAFSLVCDSREPPQGGFQVRDDRTGKWHQVEMWEVTDPDRIRLLESLAGPAGTEDES